MKRKFSTKWKGSRQPRKQRKYSANAPLHLKRKFLSVNLSRELRKKYKKRNMVARKEDTVKIMRGKFKKKNGKIISIDVKNSNIKIEGIMIKKQDGSKVAVKIHPSNLQIIELNTDDKKRKLQTSPHSSDKQPNERMKEIKEEKKESKEKIEKVSDTSHSEEKK